VIPLPRHNPRRDEHGVAAVEFAIALPLLLLLLMATAELGRLLSEYDTLEKGVRDGARYLASKALAGTTQVVSVTPTLQTQTANRVVTGNVNGSGAALLPGLTVGNVTAAAAAANGYISVTATYTYQPMLASLPTFGLSAPISLAIPLTATVNMRAL
jgi:Flp pilus assembly protein TadG